MVAKLQKHSRDQRAFIYCNANLLVRNFARRVQELRIARAIRHHRPHNPV